MKNFTIFSEKNKSGWMKVLLVVVGMVWGVGAFGQTHYYLKSGTSSAAIRNTTSWTTNSDGTGSNPADFTSNNCYYHIEHASTFSNSGTWSVSGTGSKVIIGNGTNATIFSSTDATSTSWPDVQILSGAKLLFTSSKDITISGTFDVSGILEINAASRSSVPTATWNSGSTLILSGVAANTSLPTISNQNYYNLTISGTCSSDFTESKFPNILNVSNNLTFNIGSSSLKLATGKTINTKNFIWSSTGSRLLSSGTLDMNVSGDFTINSGANLDSYAGDVNINFTGTGTFTNSGTLTTTEIDWTVNSGADLTLATNLPIEKTCTVNGTLICGTGSTDGTTNFNLTGAGTTTIASGGILKITSTAGISATASTGNVQTTTKSFSNGGIYHYIGDAAQSTGSSLPTTISGQLVINNSNGVTLTQATSVSGTVTLTSGILTTTTSNLLTITNTTTNAISTGSSSTFISGPLKRQLADAASSSGSSYCLPLGKGGFYLPLYISSYTANTTPTLTAEAYSQASGGTPPASHYLSGSEYWSVAYSGTITAGIIKAGRTASLGGLNLLLTATSANGTYSSIGGTSTTSSGVNFLESTSSIGTVSGATRYYVMGSSSCTASTGTITIGPSGNFSNLTSAIINLKACDYSGNIVLELQTNYSSSSETFPLDFTGLGSSTKNITIRPASGATGRSISGSNATAIFDLLGADYITVDGRAGGTGSTSVLTISNTNTGGSVFRFTNGSTYNTVKYCTINSAATSTVATVLFGTTSNSTGNSNNTIDNCTIAPSSSTQKYAIESTGTATYVNANNTISNCQIKDFSDDGIYINSNSDAWEINGNHLYVTSGSIGGSAAGTNIYSCVYINSGDGYTVSNNFIGGKASYCGGGYLNCINNASGDNLLYGLYFGSNITGASESKIENNFIKFLSTQESQTTKDATASGILIDCSSTSLLFKNNEVTYILCDLSSGTVNGVSYFTTNNATITDLTLTLFSNKFDAISSGGHNGNGMNMIPFNLSNITPGTNGSIIKIYNNIIKATYYSYSGNFTKFGTGTYFIYSNNFYYYESSTPTNAKTVLQLSNGTYTIYNNILVINNRSNSSSSKTSCISWTATATITHNNNYYDFQDNSSSSYIGCVLNGGSSASAASYITFANWEGSTAAASQSNCSCTGSNTGKNATGLTLNTEGKATSTTNIDNYGKDLDADGNIAVTTDYYGITRHATTPDIGAIEDNTTAWYSLTPTSNTAAQTTTNWISQRISNFNAGTITTSSSSTTVTGSGTSFSSQCAVNDKLYHSNGTLIGTISAIASNTSLTLSANATGTYSAINYVAGTQPSNFTSTTQIFKIQPGHQYQTTSTWTGAASNKVIVESGGALDINAQSIATWGSFELEGNGVSSSGALYNGSSSPATFSIPIKLTADATVTSSGSGGLTVSGNVTIGTSDGNYPLTINGSNATTIQTGVISGTASAGELIKEGTGTLTLSGDNTYVGATTINGGTVKLGAAGGATNTPLGTTEAGTIVNSGASLDLNGYTLGTTEGLTINGTGVSSVGALTNSSTTAVTWSGTVALGDATNNYIGTSGNATTGSLTVSGVISGSNPLQIVNTGATKSSIILSGNNTYTGLTTVSSGTLKLGATGDATNTPLGTTGAGTVVSSGAVLDLAGYTLGTAEALSLAGTGISSSGALMNSGSACSYSGLITLSAASSIIGGTGTINISNAGTITGATFDLTLGGAQGGTLASILGTTSGTLTKQDAGTWTLSGASTFTGNTVVQQGTLTMGAANALPITSSAGTIQFTTNANSILNLGTFDLGSSSATANSAGQLDFDVNTRVDLGSSGTNGYYFKASNGQTWSATAITINNWTGTAGSSGTGPKIYIGSDATGLSAGQLAMITFNGYTAGAAILSTGEVVPVSVTATITLASNTISAASSCASSTKVPIQSFTLAVTNGDGNLTNVGFTTTGTYAQADISKYQLWYGTSSSIGSATQLGTDLSSSGNAGVRTFTAFTSPTLSNNTTYYFWITVDVAATPTNNVTLAVNAISTSDLTSTSTKAGTTSAGGTQTLKTLPNITTHPSAATICVGGTYSPTVVASGGVTLSYQWQFSTNGSTGWASVADGTPTNSTFTNATTTTLSQTGNIAAGSAYYYRCVVSSTGNGCSNVNSNAAQLTINAVPTISVQPSAGTICVGGTYSPSVTATGGTSLTYQWQYATSNGGSYANVANSTPANATYTNGTTATLTVAGSIAAGSGNYYKCIVSDAGSGCSSVTSNEVQLTINAVPSISVQPSAGTICVGGTYSPSVTATGGTSLTYQWQYATSNGGSYANVANSTPANATYTNGTTATLTVAGSIAAGSGNYYKCVVSDAGSGCSSVTSNEVQLTINAVPAISVQPSDVTITEGGTYSPSITATGGVSLSYQWQYATTSGGVYSSVANNTPTNASYASATTNNMTMTGSVSAGTYYYKCYVTSTGSGCSAVLSNVSILTINTGVTTFYFSGSGVLSDKTNWGSNTNGTGTNPTNLTGNNLTFYVTHNTTNTPSTDASWTLGSGSKIIVGDGTNATNFNVGHTISGGTIDVSDNATLTISADTPPTLGTLANTSTVVFNGGALQNITIASGKTFGKLTLNNSNGATLTDNATIENTLTLTSGKLIVPASGTLNLGTTSTNLTMSGGSGSSYIVTTNNTSTIKRYINSNTSYVFPIGDASYYTPITYTLNSNTGLSSDYINVYVVDGVTPGFVTSNFSAYITRYWSVSPSSSARLSNYTVAYTYDNSDIVGTESTIIPVKVSGTTWYKPSNAVNITNGTPDGTGSIDIASNTLTWSNLTTYSFDTGAGDEAAALPIHLLYFTAKPEAKKVRLDWATASETNNDYFTVERSQDGEHFNELFKKPGAGISTTNLYYFGYDNKPLPGTSYYRLKQTDYDGKFAYSDVESVSLYGSDRENTIELKIYPNPAENGKFNVNFDAKQSEKYSISIYDAVGKLIYHQDYQAEKGINDYTIELPDLASGMYQLEVRNDNVGVITKSIEF